MSGDFPATSKMISPGRCNEKPWDLWVSEIGHSSPRKDDDGTFAAPASVDKPGRRAKRAPRRRSASSRLRPGAAALHAQFPHSDAMRAALCPLCGAVVKVAAAARHLAAAHAGAALPPPLPPPAPSLSKLKPPAARARHKRDAPPPLPADLLPAEPPPPPPSLAPPDLQYLEEAGPSAEVQVSLESGELPVVSIQDTDDLPLGENITDDIFAIMNSEGIQSADDVADWKNIIRDIGKMQDLSFSQPPDAVPAPELYTGAEAAALAAFSLGDADLPAPAPPPPRAPPAPPPPPPPPALPARTHSRSKTSKSKFPQREYDPNKHCGVVTAENPKPCTRSLTCKAHALSLRRTVVGRAKPFDTLLAEHRAARDAGAPAAVALAAVTAPAAEPAPGDDAAAEAGEQLCWLGAAPRPLALCTYNAAAAGGAVTLGKRFATVRSSLKSALARGAGTRGGARGAGGARAPELRRLVARAADRRTNGHVAAAAKHAALLPLAFLDPLLADDKC